MDLPTKFAPANAAMVRTCEQTPARGEQGEHAGGERGIITLRRKPRGMGARVARRIEHDEVVALRTLSRALEPREYVIIDLLMRRAIESVGHEVLRSPRQHAT